MSWSFSLALAEELSRQGLWDTESSEQSRSTRSAEKSSFDDKKTTRSHPSPSGTTLDPSTANRVEKSRGGLLNPTWVEWLMGWPTGWTDFKHSATESSHFSI